MNSNVQDARKRLTEATVGQKKLATDKTAPFEVPSRETLTLDLGSTCTVKTLVFSRDRTGFYMDTLYHTPNKYEWETSLDEKDWKPLANPRKSGRPAIGQIDAIQPTQARYLRLKLFTQFNLTAKLDDVSVYGE